MKTGSCHPQLRIASCAINLVTDASNIERYWRTTFVQWVKDEGESTAVTATLQLQLVKQLPALPDETPYFIDTRTHILEAYQRPDGGILLHFFDGGLIEISADTRHITGQITANLFRTGAIDDVTLVSLAPFLRSQGIYLLHAAGVVYHDKAVLFVGQSHSGKTTTCLNLVLNGWQLLANDVVLIQQQADGIVALPLPDMISLRPKTADLLPQLLPLLPTPLPTTFHAGSIVNNNWAKPAPIVAICFPKITPQAHSQLTPLPQMIMLAHLLEESLDAWDTRSLATHTQCLSNLTRQAGGYQLILGHDVASFPTWFTEQILG